MILLLTQGKRVWNKRAFHAPPGFSRKRGVSSRIDAATAFRKRNKKYPNFTTQEWVLEDERDARLGEVTGHARRKRPTKNPET